MANNECPRHVALPSKQELNFIECLVHLFHHKMYNIRLNRLSTHLRSIIGSIANKLFGWYDNYRQWCLGMRDLRLNYMLPLVEKFSEASGAQAEYNDFQTRIGALRTALSGKIPDQAELTEDIVKKLNLSARRLGPAYGLKRYRTRYKREHTL